MLSNSKKVLFSLCAVMFVVNGYMGMDSLAPERSFIGAGIGMSAVSIPVWSCIGVVLVNIGFFLWRTIKPIEVEVVSFDQWQKASLGLFLGIILKLSFGVMP
jgi:hypothetical protein